jgi:hypothetical protein
MLNNQEKIALTRLSSELVALTGTSPTYKQPWNLTVDGSIPAKQVNGRWHVARDDVPAIATKLGLPVPIAA